jgi:hypothetical protein
LRDRHKEFIDRNIRVAVIGQGTHEDMQAFLETRPVPFETFADPERESYQAYGLARGSWRQVAYSPSVLRAGAAAALEGHIVGTPMGDPMQLPGSFVIADGIVVYAHRAKTSADTAPIDELLAAV